MFTRKKIKALNIREYKKLELLNALRSSRISLLFKVAIHILSIGSTTLYLQGVLSSSFTALLLNYGIHLSDLKSIMVTSLALSFAGSSILELSTVEIGSKLGDIVKEYLKTDTAWRKKELIGRLLFFTPLALSIMLLQVITFTNGAVNTSKLIEPPLSIETQTKQIQRDISFSMARIERARKEIERAESGKLVVTKDMLDSNSINEQMKDILKVYQPQLEAAQKDLIEAKNRYKRYLELEKSKKSNYVNGVLSSYAKMLMGRKKDELLSPALSKINSIKEIINQYRASLKPVGTKEEYIKRYIQDKNRIIDRETSNLDKYKREQELLEQRVQQREKAIQDRIDYEWYLIAGFALVFIQILIEMWFKIERENFYQLIETNRKNSERNERQKEELSIPDIEFHVKQEEPVKIEVKKEGSDIDFLKEEFPELFNMCVKAVKRGERLPSKKEMISHVLVPSVVNRFRRQANGLLYTVDTSNGNAAEWTKQFMDSVQGLV